MRHEAQWQKPVSYTSPILMCLEMENSMLSMGLWNNELHHEWNKKRKYLAGRTVWKYNLKFVQTDSKWQYPYKDYEQISPCIFSLCTYLSVYHLHKSYSFKWFNIQSKGDFCNDLLKLYFKSLRTLWLNHCWQHKLMVSICIF